MRASTPRRANGGVVGGQRVFSPETARTVRGLDEGVVTREDGTGKQARLRAMAPCGP